MPHTQYSAGAYCIKSRGVLTKKESHLLRYVKQLPMYKKM